MATNFCSFCGRHHKFTIMMVRSKKGRAAICYECISHCKDIADEWDEKEAEKNDQAN